MPLCRSTTCSAASPASAARRMRAEQPGRPRRSTATDRQSASIPTSVPACRGASVPILPARPSRRARPTAMTYKVDQYVRASRSPARRPTMSHPPKPGAIFNKLRVLLLHRADAAAGRDRRDSGRLLRRSGYRRGCRGALRQHHHAELYLLPPEPAPQASGAGRRGVGDIANQLTDRPAGLTRREEPDGDFNGRGPRQTSRLPPGRR